MRTMRHVGKVAVAAAFAVAVLFFAEPVRADWVRSGNYIVEEGVEAGSAWKLWVNGTSGDITISYSTTYKHTAGTNTTLDLSMPVTDGSKIVAVANYALRSGAINFTGKPPVERIVLPSTLKSIGDDSFTGNASLREVTPLLPDSVTTVGTKAFQNLATLTGDLRLYSLTNVISYAFQNTGISSAWLPSATNINSYAFSGCSSLTNVVFGDNRVSLGAQSFPTIAPHAILRFPKLAPYPTFGTDALKGTNANPYFLAGSLVQDKGGWVAVTNSASGSAVLSTDKVHAYYPGLATFGILVSGGIRSWLVDADSTNWFLTVTSNNGTAFGAVTPAYGMSGVLATGTVLACSSPSFITNGILYRAVSYVWEDLQADFTWGNAVTNSGNSFTYTQNACSHRLTWLWQAMGYYLDTSVPGAVTGTVTADPQPDLELGCYAPGTVVTLTAQSGAGETFSRWLGDVPPAQATQTSITLTMDQSYECHPAFGTDWTLNRTANTLTDCNWTFAVTIANTTNISVTTFSSVTTTNLLNFGTSVKDTDGVACQIVSVSGLAARAGLVYVVFPTGLKTITKEAFRACSGLRFVSPFLPSTLTALGGRAFSMCTSLEGDMVLDTGGTVTVDTSWSANSDGFFKNSRITSADFSGCTISTIPTDSFNGCTKLKWVRLPDGLASLGSSAFDSCTALESVTPFLPDTLTSMSYSVFYNCTSLTGDLVLSGPSLSMSHNNNQGWRGMFTAAPITSVTITAPLVMLPSSTFQSCTQLRTAVLPETLATIESSAFISCSALETVEPFLPASVTSIGIGAFQDCANLKRHLALTSKTPILLYHNNNNNQGAFCGAGIVSADLSGNIPILRNGTFNANPNLGFVMLSASVTNIESDAFASATSLTNLYFLGECPTTISSSFLRSAPNYQVRVFIPRNRPGWEAYRAANIPAPTEAELATFQTKYPGATPLPVGVWNLPSGTHHWVHYWVPPNDQLRGTILFVR